MQPDSGGRRCSEVELVRRSGGGRGHDGPEHAGEHIAGARRREPRRAGLDDHAPAVGAGDHRRRAFQHDDGSDGGSGLDGGDATLVVARTDLGMEAERGPQAGVLARVRGQHAWRGRPARKVERAGVDHHRVRARQDRAQRRGLGIRSVVGIGPRPDDPGLHTPWGRHGLGPSGEHQRCRPGGSEVAHHADSGAPRRLDAEHRSAGVSVRAGADADHASGILVIGGRWHPENARRVFERP